jgi:hypothetical protein
VPPNEERSETLELRKKSSVANLSTSKVNSPLNQILQSQSPKGSNNHSMRLDQNKSLTKDISQTSIKNYTNTSFLSSRNPNDLSVQVINCIINLNV